LKRFWFYLLYHYNWPLANFLVQIFKVCFHILQSIFWLIWILSYLTLFLAFQIDHLDIKINVFNRNSCLPPILNPNIIFFSFMLTVPIFKVFIKIVMFDMKRFVTHINVTKHNLYHLRLANFFLYKHCKNIYKWLIISLKIFWYLHVHDRFTYSFII
jgi:hypothetical protein